MNTEDARLIIEAFSKRELRKHTKALYRFNVDKKNSRQKQALDFLKKQKHLPFKMTIEDSYIQFD